MIVLEGVSKHYRSFRRRGAVQALSDVSLTIHRGEIVGLAGPNGAGKSTLISLILGYLEPTAGQVRIDGRSPRPYVVATGIGYLPELIAIPAGWTVDGALRRFASLGGAPLQRIEAAIETTGLAEHRFKAVKTLSKGTMQRLGLAQALLADREVMILDEPTHGLDPLWTQRFRDIVQALRRPDRSIFIASHNLDELERVADRVAIIHQGRLDRIVTSGQASTATLFRLTLAAPCAGLFEAFPGAEAVEGRSNEFRVRGDLVSLNLSLARLIALGGQVAGFYAEESRLESEFRAVVGEERP
ncbi:MAG: ABC transporter ATP-binding protein [Gemmatimonadales bacterium]|nr:ABC transporter ATP-binding protein [Gemmatimonadales bacterium]